MGSYRVGQACLRGHAITGDAHSAFASPYCGQCGEETIISCRSCGADIRGRYEGGAVVLAGWRPTPHCHQCGAAYPWTQSKLDAITELVEAIEELTSHERDVIRELAPHLIEDTPRTTPASFKVATIVGKLGGHAGKTMKKLLEEVAVEAAKKSLGF